MRLIKWYARDFLVAAAHAAAQQLRPVPLVRPQMKRCAQEPAGVASNATRE